LNFEFNRNLNYTVLKKYFDLKFAVRENIWKYIYTLILSDKFEQQS